ncbi:MAG: aldehyde dehydrogenase family protein [Alphaproteobacteria bacterium]|nr:aldehyde dehydrogenase family protein [Alphaproteobacteria bacterium]
MTQTQKTVSPVDGRTYVERRYAEPIDLDAMLERASRAQKAWREVPMHARGALLARARDAFVAKAAGIAEEISWQIGRPIRQSPGEVRGFNERATAMIELGAKALADIDPGPKDKFRRFVRREALGTVLVVAPWNYPYLTAVNSVWPALMAGNAVILKHSAQTPLCAERFAEALAEAGLPEHVFQTLVCDHQMVAKAVGDPRVAFVAFTGSVPGGHAIQHAAAQRFIATGLELGGKDPAYVRPDCDFDQAVDNLVDGSFFNSGQSCCGIERIYVHESLFDRFVDAFVALTEKYVLGNPLDPATTLGPVVRASAAEAIHRQIDQAMRAGARALIDPRRFKTAKRGTPYMAPQVLVNVDHGMAVMTEETFGPVVGIMKVRGDEEAIRLMNDSKFGLTASIWTRDLDAALRVGDRVETGTWFMNRCDYLDPYLAWVGVKDSGRGATLSLVGYEQLTRPKSFHLRLSF